MIFRRIFQRSLWHFTVLTRRTPRVIVLELLVFWFFRSFCAAINSELKTFAVISRRSFVAECKRDSLDKNQTRRSIVHARRFPFGTGPYNYTVSAKRRALEMPRGRFRVGRLLWYARTYIHILYRNVFYTRACSDVEGKLVTDKDTADVSNCAKRGIARDGAVSR